MTQKDYIAIAKVLRKQRIYYANRLMSDVTTQVVRDVTQELADVMAKDNPRFKRDVFLKAVGV